MIPLSLESLTFQRELVARCCVSYNCDPFLTIQTVSALSCTNKAYNSIIKHKSFFNTIIRLIDPNHPSLREENRKETQTSFEYEYFKIRNNFLPIYEIFNGNLGSTALINENGLEIISFDFNKRVVNFRLKDNSLFQCIEIPIEDMGTYDDSKLVKPPLIAQTATFLAIHLPHNSIIYIYKKKEVECFGRYEVSGSIYQLTIQNNLLCVVEGNTTGPLNLVVFNLNLSQHIKPLKISLPQSFPPFKQISFGQEYLVYTENLLLGDRLHALLLSCLQDEPINWIIDKNESICCRYILSNKDHFIEVNFRGHHCCEIAKFNITSSGFLKKNIVENIWITKNMADFFLNICFHNNRVIFAYEELSLQTKIFSYDILFRKLSHLFSTPQLSDDKIFKKSFLKTATSVYYLTMSRGSNEKEIESHLITLNSLI